MNAPDLDLVEETKVAFDVEAINEIIDNHWCPVKNIR